jgi:hypothetical protein
MPLARVQREIDDGIASVTAALGDPAALAPFFRIPGLLRAEPVEDYLASHAIMTWSADFPADDWKHIKASEVMSRALARIEAKGRGVLLLHDIQPATVIALPGLLRELKLRGYRIVHVEPASATLPKTATTASQWLLRAKSEADQPPLVAAPSQVPAQAPAEMWPQIGPPSGVIGAGAPARRSIKNDNAAPQAPRQDAPRVAPTPPAGEIIGSVGANGRLPVSNANMSKTGIPWRMPRRWVRRQRHAPKNQPLARSAPSHV